MHPRHHSLLRSCAFYYARGQITSVEYREFRRQVIHALVQGQALPAIPEEWHQEPPPEDLPPPKLTPTTQQAPVVMPQANPQTLLMLAITALILLLIISLFI